MEKSKSLMTIMWGLIIGCIIVFMDEFISLQWKIEETIMILEIGPLLAFFIIWLFSFFYLRSIKSGVLCGFVAGFSYQLLKSFISNLYSRSIIGWVFLPLIYILAGFIGGYLAMRENL